LINENLAHPISQENMLYLCSKETIMVIIVSLLHQIDGITSGIVVATKACAVVLCLGCAVFQGLQAMKKITSKEQPVFKNILILHSASKGMILL